MQPLGICDVRDIFNGGAAPVPLYEFSLHGIPAVFRREVLFRLKKIILRQLRDVTERAGRIPVHHELVAEPAGKIPLRVAGKLGRGPVGVEHLPRLKVADLDDRVVLVKDVAVKLGLPGYIVKNRVHQRKAV
ncbi:hypothetical protein SDC9_152140 [bioreactor metagenome]|uniref:Uncharacterized protein n=1 Tax=bioreactor metagenome TaxID=1076179 RepID=A0A645EUJ3_9ZZZZ